VGVGGLGYGGGGLGPNPQSPIPNPQSPSPTIKYKKLIYFKNNHKKILIIQ